MRRAAVNPIRVIGASARVALADLQTVYTPFTWSVGWLGRIIMQVIFFALIGLLLGSEDAIRFLFIGQAVMVCVVECFMAVPSTTWERKTGTLALLVSSPGRLWPVFVGRSLQWLPSGIATSTIVMFAIGPLFGVTWSLGGAAIAVGVLVLVASSMYAVALSVAAVVLRGPRWRNVASNLSHGIVMLLCGVTVPAAIWPQWVQGIAQSLPLSHGLTAIRDLQAGAVFADTVPAIALTAVTGACWYFVAIIAFTLFGEAGRRDGSIDFSE